MFAIPLTLSLTAGLALAGGSGAPLKAATVAPVTTAVTPAAATPAGGMQMPPGGQGSLPQLATTRKPAVQNLAYATVSKAQQLDIYLPSGTGPFPTLIWVHGGGFSGGTQKDMDPVLGQAILDAGYAIVSVNYRLSGEAKFPAAVQDVKAAVRYARAHAATYKLDPARFAVFGESAGGNLAALIGTTGDAKTIFDAPELGNASVSSAVKVVVEFFGPNDFSKIDTYLTAEGCKVGGPVQVHNSAMSSESVYLGAALPTIPAKVKEANPITYVDAKDPVFLLQYGSKDCVVGGGQIGLMADALTKAGVTYSADFFQGGGHGGPDFFYNTVNGQRVVAFLNRYLK